MLLQEGRDRPHIELEDLFKAFGDGFSFFCLPLVRHERPGLLLETLQVFRGLALELVITLEVSDEHHQFLPVLLEVSVEIHLGVEHRCQEVQEVCGPHVVVEYVQNEYIHERQHQRGELLGVAVSLASQPVFSPARALHVEYHQLFVLHRRQARVFLRHLARTHGRDPHSVRLLLAAFLQPVLGLEIAVEHGVQKGGLPGRLLTNNRYLADVLVLRLPLAVLQLSEVFCQVSI